MMYISIYDKFFDRIICQNIKGDVIKENEISYEIFKTVKDKITANNGTCENEYLFTPDGEYCYKCNDELVGMPGCKGGCSFSLERNKPLRCKGECETGYIESYEGICSPCTLINKGCHECHYEAEYPIEYKGIKRKRRFVCDDCEEGFMQLSSGECLDCIDLGLTECSKCKIDPNNDFNYICIQCSENFFVNKEGICETCDDYHFKGINKNECIECGNTLEGGIDNCLFCDSIGEKTKCKLCLPGYLLLTNNNSCLEIVKNKELQYFGNCEQLTMEKNKLICSKCKKEYSLIKKNNIKECAYIPALYDAKLSKGYEYHIYSITKKIMSEYDFNIFKDTDYIYNKIKDFYPCQEAENLATEENPLYSCTKCYEYLGKKIDYRSPVRITEENSRVSYCIDPKNHDELKNCTEATYKIKNGKEIYNCIECNKNYILIFNKNTFTYYCQFNNAKTKCLVPYCKTCNIHDNYACDECSPDYELNGLTGYCVKKSDIIPAVTWKDIYRLEMNHGKLINNGCVLRPS